MLSLRADLGGDAYLQADPGGLIVCAGSRVDVAVDVRLGAHAALDWRELIVLGRAGEPAGEVTLRWNVTRLGRPVLRQFVDLRDPVLTGWTGMTGQRRMFACALMTGPQIAATTIARSATSVAHRIDDQTVLATVLGSGTAEATRELGDLCGLIYECG
jgi:urease accessory protein